MIINFYDCIKGGSGGGSTITETDGILTADGKYDFYTKDRTDLEIAESIEGLEHSVNADLDKKQDKLYADDEGLYTKEEGSITLTESSTEPGNSWVDFKPDAQYSLSKYTNTRRSNESAEYDIVDLGVVPSFDKVALVNASPRGGVYGVNFGMDNPQVQVGLNNTTYWYHPIEVNTWYEYKDRVGDENAGTTDKSIIGKNVYFITNTVDGKMYGMLSTSNVVETSLNDYLTKFKTVNGETIIGEGNIDTSVNITEKDGIVSIGTGENGTRVINATPDLSTESELHDCFVEREEEMALSAYYANESRDVIIVDYIYPNENSNRGAYIYRPIFGKDFHFTQRGGMLASWDMWYDLYEGDNAELNGYVTGPKNSSGFEDRTGRFYIVYDAETGTGKWKYSKTNNEVEINSELAVEVYTKDRTDLEIAESIEGLERSMNEELDKKQDKLEGTYVRLVYEDAANSRLVVPTKYYSSGNEVEFGANFKRINGESIIGIGDIEIKGGGSESTHVDLDKMFFDGNDYYQIDQRWFDGWGKEEVKTEPTYVYAYANPPIVGETTLFNGDVRENVYKYNDWLYPISTASFLPSVNESGYIEIEGKKYVVDLDTPYSVGGEISRIFKLKESSDEADYSKQVFTDGKYWVFPSLIKSVNGTYWLILATNRGGSGRYNPSKKLFVGGTEITYDGTSVLSDGNYSWYNKITVDLKNSTFEDKLEKKQDKLSGNYLVRTQYDEERNNISIFDGAYNSEYSGENIIPFKTVNGEGILGSGNIEIQGGGASIVNEDGVLTDGDNRWYSKDDFDFFHGDIPDDEIWYKTTDGNIVQDRKFATKGVEIISNIYENGFGKAKFNGPITDIGDSFFSIEETTEYIKFPNTLKYIGKNFMTSCSSLKTVDFSNAVITSVDQQSFFYNTKNLENIDFSNVLFSNIGDSFLSGNKNLRSIKLPDTLGSIGNNFLESCSSLRTIEIPDNVKSIGNRFLYKNTLLTSVKLPKRLETIGDQFIYDCPSLIIIEIPDNVKSIGTNFLRSTKITELDLSNTKLTSAGEYFLGYNTALTSLKLPNTLTSFDTNRFLYSNNNNGVLYYPLSKQDDPLYQSIIAANRSTWTAEPYDDSIIEDGGKEWYSKEYIDSKLGDIDALLAGI